MARRRGLDIVICVLLVTWNLASMKRRKSSVSTANSVCFGNIGRISTKRLTEEKHWLDLQVELTLFTTFLELPHV